MIYHGQTKETSENVRKQNLLKNMPYQALENDKKMLEDTNKHYENKYHTTIGERQKDDRSKWNQ